MNKKNFSCRQKSAIWAGNCGFVFLDPSNMAGKSLDGKSKLGAAKSPESKPSKREFTPKKDFRS